MGGIRKIPEHTRGVSERAYVYLTVVIYAIFLFFLLYQNLIVIPSLPEFIVVSVDPF